MDELSALLDAAQRGNAAQRAGPKEQAGPTAVGAEMRQTSAVVRSMVPVSAPSWWSGRWLWDSGKFARDNSVSQMHQCILRAEQQMTEINAQNTKIISRINEIDTHMAKVTDQLRQSLLQIQNACRTQTEVQRKHAEYRKRPEYQTITCQLRMLAQQRETEQGLMNKNIQTSAWLGRHVGLVQKNIQYLSVTLPAIEAAQDLMTHAALPEAEKRRTQMQIENAVRQSQALEAQAITLSEMDATMAVLGSDPSPDVTDLSVLDRSVDAMLDSIFAETGSTSGGTMVESAFYAPQPLSQPPSQQPAQPQPQQFPLSHLPSAPFTPANTRVQTSGSAPASAAASAAAMYSRLA